MVRYLLLMAMVATASCARSDPVDDAAASDTFELDNNLVVQIDDGFANDDGDCADAECDS